MSISSHKECREKEQALEVRLHIAASLVALLNQAFDALQAYGVNYRDCRTWKEADNPLLDSTPCTERQARDRLVLFLGRMHNDLAAAVQRKQHVRKVK